jgi:hypothetical protein
VRWIFQEREAQSDLLFSITLAHTFEMHSRATVPDGPAADPVVADARWTQAGGWLLQR